MLTVHHLGKSQSERIVWRCEELEIPYALQCYARDPVTMLAPPDYKALHPTGTAPVITDGDLVLAESGAVVEYIIGRYGNGRLALTPDHQDFRHFVFWFHFANGTLQANMGRNMILNRLKLPPGNPILLAAKSRVSVSPERLKQHLPPSTLSAPSTSSSGSGGLTPERWSAGAVGRSIVWRKSSRPICRASLKPYGYLGLLEYLPAGDALLTRRAKSKSSRHAVVVRFSRTRRRYERQGLLVEPQALADAQKS